MENSRFEFGGLFIGIRDILGWDGLIIGAGPTCITTLTVFLASVMRSKLTMARDLVGISVIIFSNKFFFRVLVIDK